MGWKTQKTGAREGEDNVKRRGQEKGTPIGGTTKGRTLKSTKEKQK